MMSAGAPTLPELALLSCAAVVTLALYAGRPVLDRLTVLAALPWLAVTAPLHTLAPTVGYPAVVRSLLMWPWVFLLVGTLWGCVWLLISQFVDGDRAERRTAWSLTLVGVGAAVSPFALLVGTYGLGLPRAALLAWAVSPLLACLMTYVLLASMWVWLPQTASFAGVSGAVILFGLTLQGTVLALGGGTPTWPMAVVAARVAATAGVGFPEALVWVTVWTRLLLAVVGIVALGALHRWRDTLADRALDAATLGSVALASQTFVLVLVGGGVA